MQFEVSPQGLRFEIPDEWWAFAEMVAFSSGGRYYPYCQVPEPQEIDVLPLSEIEPPTRSNGVPLFKKYKMVPVLFAFQSPECALPPVEIYETTTPEGYRYRVRNGYHRYYASVAVGYSKLPVVLVPPPFEFEIAGQL